MKPFITLMGADPSEDRLFFFETSWLFSPLIFSYIRGFISLYLFTTIFFIFGWRGTHGQSESNIRSFSFFTHLSYWGLAFYFLVAAIHTFLYARTGRSVLFDKWPRGLRAMHGVFLSTITVFPFLVVATYWGMLYDGDWYIVVFEAWIDITQHALPPLFSLFEIIFTTAPPRPLLHLPFLILILLLYLSLAYTVHATQGYYTYAFLDPGIDNENSKRVVKYAFALFAATVAIFFVVSFIMWLRRRLVGAEKRKLAKERARALDVEVAMEGVSYSLVAHEEEEEDHEHFDRRLM